MALKLGMMPIWTKTGERHAVTMLQVIVVVLPQSTDFPFNELVTLYRSNGVCIVCTL